MAGGLQSQSGIVRSAHCRGPGPHRTFKPVTKEPTDLVHIQHLHLGQLGNQASRRESPRVSLFRLQYSFSYGVWGIKVRG